MPFTPYHLGPALFLGLLAYRWLDLPSVLAASVLVDVRAALVLFGHLDGPIHGPFHTLVGSAVVALLIAGAWYALRDWLGPLLAWFGLERSRSADAILGGALAGAWLHVALDALLYADVALLAPITAWNPLFDALGGPTTYVLVYLACVATGVLGAAIYLLSVLFPGRGVALGPIGPRTIDGSE